MGAELSRPGTAAVSDTLPAPLRATQPWQRPPWHQRLLQRVSVYLPLLLMAVLALATWWLVKHSPMPLAPPEERPASSDPDYSMTHFSLERFDATGRMKLRIEGDRLIYLKDTENIEIDTASIRAIAADGRVTLAKARQAVANGDGSEVQLLGGAEVISLDAGGAPVVMRSEFLHLFVVLERVKSNRPVHVQHGGTDVRAAGLDYDHATQKLDLQGPLRSVLSPREPPVASASAPGAVAPRR